MESSGLQCVRPFFTTVDLPHNQYTSEKFAPIKYEFKYLLVNFGSQKTQFIDTEGLLNTCACWRLLPSKKACHSLLTTKKCSYFVPCDPQRLLPVVAATFTLVPAAPERLNVTVGTTAVQTATSCFNTAWVKKLWRPGPRSQKKITLLSICYTHHTHTPP